MKKRYDVSGWLGGISLRYSDQREAFNLAKQIAEQDGEALMIELVWTGDRITSLHTVAVKADGTYRHIN